jgi:hypothetical protein
LTVRSLIPSSSAMPAFEGELAEERPIPWFAPPEGKEGAAD